MGRSRRSYDDSDSEDYGAPIAVTKTYTAGRHDGRTGRRHSPGEVSVRVDNHLSIPGGGSRLRSASQGAAAQPTVIVLDDHRSPSRERRRSRSRRSSSGSSDRHRHHRRPSWESERDYEMRKMMDRMKHQNDRSSEEQQKEKLLAQIARDKQKEKEREEQIAIDLERKKQKEKDDRKRILEDAKLQEERDKLKAKEERERVLLEWKREEFEKEEKKKKEAKEFDAKFEADFRAMFLAQGYTKEQCDIMLEKRKEKGKRHGSHSDSMALAMVDYNRPTYIKVHRKHLDVRTLDHFGLPWDYDTKDTEYIIIKKWISSDVQEELFAHTRCYYHGRRMIEPSPVIKETITTLRPNDRIGRSGDGLYVERRKSTAGRSRSRSRGAVIRFLAS